MVPQRVLAAVVLLLSGLSGWSQVSSPQRLIAGPVDESQIVRAPGNTHPLAQAQFDRGVAPDNLPMERMQLVLKRTALQELALQKLLVDLQDKSSPSYHQWVTPEQFGAQFGPSDADVQTVVSWLESKGFQVGGVSKGRLSIEFSGTAGQVGQAFGTEVHKYNVNGESHWANSDDPAIPAVLMPVVEGVASLHNFLAAPQVKIFDERFTRNESSGLLGPQFTNASGGHALAPADFATIYNTNNAGTYSRAGAGVTVAVVGRSNINLQNVSNFRSLFLLSSNTPQVIVNGPDPGALGGGEELEAVLDTTWSGAVAQNATIKLVVSASTNTTDGITLSELYIIDNNLASVMTESFGSCEASYSRTQSAYTSLLAEQAAAEGITYVVSSGDSGAAGCDAAGAISATGPLSVNVLASSPYTIAVGGTQFNDLANPSKYWTAPNYGNYGSALSYIPENVWNEGIVGSTLYASGGGASIYFPKPTWQAGVAGIPADGARDLPDVSFSAAAHDPYLLCFNGSCGGTAPALYGVSGTSASAPAFAGIMAMVDSNTVSRQGQANPVLYRMASAEALASCNGSSTNGRSGSECVFNDITVGNNAVRGENGFGTASAPYQAGVGYDLATGLGSVDALNLLVHWNYGNSSYFFIPHDFGPISLNVAPVLSGLPPQISAPRMRFGIDFSIFVNGIFPYVSFSPKYPGLREDGVIAQGGPSPVTLTRGTGVAPQAVISPGLISTFAGNGSAGYLGDGGFATGASFNRPRSLAVDPAGNIYLADSLNNVVRKVNAQTGVVTTIAGTGSAGLGGDGGLATAAQLNQPLAVALDGVGNIYIADSGNSLVRKVDTITGLISTIAGTGTSGFSNGGGVATNATLGRPSGLATDPAGNLFISDDVNGVVWKLNAGTNSIAVFAGTGIRGYNGDGGPARNAQLLSPEGLATDVLGNLYIADAGSNVVRKVTNLTITTVAGNGTAGYSGDGNVAANAQLSGPSGVALDAAGDLFIADTGNSDVRRVSVLTNTITTIAGFQIPSYTGDGGPANSAGLDNPNSVVLDGPGNLFIATQNNVVRKISSTSSALNFTQSGTTQTALVSNFGNQQLVLSGISLPTGYTQVSSGSSDCSTSSVLPPGGVCSIAISSSAPASAQPGALTVTDNSYTLLGSRQTVTLTSVGSPEASLSTNLVSFGVQPVGKTAPQRAFTISNTGSATLSLTGIFLGGANAADFTLSSACGSTLTVGASCTLTASFTPGTAGYRSASIAVTDNAANSPLTIVLNGTGAIPQWLINIDRPSTAYSSFQGTALLSGSAIFNITAVSSIAIAVDGVPVGNASYGLARTDVCAPFPNTPGCPNVGWSYSLDTTTLSNGAHSLSAIATAVNGQRSARSAPFVVANWTTASPIQIAIDAPDSQSTYSGSVSFGGWAVDDSAAISGVVISIDGVPYSNASYGGLRSDVCAVYSGRPGCPNVGWNALFNTALIPDGLHTLEVTARSTSGQRLAITKPFTVSNAGSPIHVSIDSPTAQSAAISGSASIGGWAVADSAQIISVLIRVDEVSLGTASYGGTRTDVCQVFTSRPGCPNVGWNYVLNSAPLTNGKHLLEVTAYTATGAATVSTSFTVNNLQGTSGSRVSIDVPTLNSGPYLGFATFSGWALNDGGPITQVAYTVDNVPFGSANYGGSRPDVCQAFPGRAGCPNVGWSLTFDTTQLPSGQHTLGIIGKSGTQQVTASAAFTVANWATSNPLTLSIDRPSAQSGPLTGITGVGGWAIDSMSAIASISVAVDGVPFGNALYGGTRPDVCAAYPGVAGCPNVGWNFGLDTTLLADGPHTFEVTATSTGGEHYTVTVPMTVANANGNPIRINIDSPNVGTGPQSGVVVAGGWAIADNGTITNVAVLVDGEPYGNASYGGLRSDVCQAFPGRPGCPSVGWNFALDTTALANGSHTITITAQSSTGQRSTVSNAFTVGN